MVKRLCPVCKKISEFYDRSVCCDSCYKKQWRLKNLKKQREYERNQKRKQRLDPEFRKKENELNKTSYIKNQEKRLNYMKKYRLKNIDERREYDKRYDKIRKQKQGMSLKIKIRDYTNYHKKEVLSKDSVCANCSSKSNLQIHHKKYTKNPKDWEVLCEKCHSKLHRKYKKKDLNKSDV